MPAPFTPSPLEPSWPLQMVLDGEVLTHTNLIAGLIQPSLEYTAFVNARINGLLGAAAGGAAQRFLETQIPTSASWSLQPTGIYNTTAATAQTLIMPIPGSALPHGATLTGAVVNILPANHASITSLVLPTIEVYRFSTAGLVQIGATTPDPTIGFSSYNLQHDIAIASLSHMVDRSINRYFLLFTSEHGGGNATSGLAVVGATVTFTPP